ncbi:choice-of-anchor Q domain-containing protein [Nannocystis exedens]|uniref:choice-of-anchor Q domain-containing protein n=1 Tax=Nannocystis exedens TaxID=54 RepID=UPI000BBA08A7|nr:choice-of-anchor Q domain-containing protein [Nannocystis exedens]PCC73808.1 hypothetical protein NAEX_06896 [Nannocystis exedens]
MSSLVCGETTDLAPQFENPPGDLRLQPSSPLLDAGDAAALPSDVADLDADGNFDETIPLDLDGLARVAGAAIDLGAYELP